MSSRRLRNFALRCSLVALATFALAECAWRWLMFSPSADGWKIAEVVRRPEMYGDPQRSDRYWEVLDVLVREEHRAPDPAYDPWLGWTSRRFSPRTYQHGDELKLDGRRPVLLLGDSYSHCVTLEADCFHELFARSTLASDFAMLNFGVASYGVDQISLLLRQLLERGRDDDPVYVVGILINDDFDRCALRMRSWPKPRLQLRDGKVEREPGDVPTTEQYFERDPVWRTSWLAAAVAHGLARADDGETDLELQALVRATLLDMIDALRTSGHAYMFVLYYHDPYVVLDPRRTGWRDQLVREVLDASGAPYLDVAAAMRTRAGNDPKIIANWFGGHPQYHGHYNPEGNRVVSEALIEALQSKLGLSGRGPLPRVDMIARVDAPGELAFARFRVGLQAPFTEPQDARRLVVRVARNGPTVVHYDLQGLVSEFTALARVVSADEAQGGSVGVRFVADGVELGRYVLRDGEPSLELRVDLAGRESLQIHVDDASDGARGDRIVFSSPKFVLGEL